MRDIVMKKLCLLLFALLCVTADLCGFELVKNGELKFSGIVLRDGATSSEKKAAEELCYHLFRATGKIPALLSEKTVRPGKKYIFLGRCRSNLAGGLAPEKMERNSGIIAVEADAVRIAGNDGARLWNQENNSAGTLFAVYEFLERYLDVRWLWPGETGTFVPVKKNVRLAAGKTLVKAKTKSSLWRNVKGVSVGWKKAENHQKFLRDQTQWLKRHRFSCDTSYQLGHAFIRHYRLYGKSNPDFFSLLPDGTRRPNPYNWSNGAPHCVTMCVSNPALVQKVVSDWKNTQPRAPRINLNENDSLGDCVCKACLASDNSPVPDALRLKRAKKLFNEKKRSWVKELGSLSDRYCQFYLNVQKEADKIDPKHEIMGLIYANFSQVPSRRIKLNERITLRFCPPFMYPWTKEKVAEYKRIFRGWSETGAKIMFRPNFTWSGGYFPVQYQDVFYDLYTFSAPNIVAVDMDSLTGHYAVQGLVNYVIASLNHDRESSLEKRKADFCAAFGTAAPHVREYFDYVTRVSMEPVLKERGSTLPEGSSLYLKFFTVADQLFTPQIMARCKKILDRAANAPGLTPMAAERVRFLQNGLKNTELTMAAQKEFRKYEKGAPVIRFVLAVQKLDAFRASIEHTNAFNMGNIRFMEERIWPVRAGLELIGTDAVELKNWKILFDPQNVGSKGKWFLPSFDLKNAQSANTASHWNKLPIGVAWKKKHGVDFLGTGWYFHHFDSPVKKGVKGAELLFQSLDGSALIYLNGKLICDHPYPYKGNRQSWREPFKVQLPPELLKKKNNFLAIRIEKHEGLAGIWRPVNLIPCK